MSQKSQVIWQKWSFSDDNSDERNSGRVKMGTNKLHNIAFSLGPQVAAQISSADWSRLSWLQHIQNK